MSSDEESDRPRRLEDGTVVYLLSIASKLDEAKKLGNDTLALEEQEIIVNNVFEEVKGRSASAACDKRTNSIIEQLLLMANLPVLLETMSKFTKYAKFLTLNRHSSHVLQSLFARTGQVLKSGAVAEELEAETTRAVLAIARAILAPRTLDMALKDMCGSHVVRSLISLLAGIPAIGEKRSKGAKHQHSNTLAAPLESLLEPDCFYVASSVAFVVPSEFHECLAQELAGHLLSCSTAELHAHLTNTHSCAALTLLLRVLTNPALVSGASKIASQLVYKMLGAPETVGSGPLGPLYEHMVSAAAGRVDPVTGAALTSSSDAEAMHQQTVMAWEACADVVADMSESPTATFFLEAVAECADLELVCCLLYYTVLLNGTLVDFAASNNANYFVQACCRRLGGTMRRLVAQLAEGTASSKVTAAIMLKMNVARGLVFKVAGDLFATTATTADGTTTTSISSALYRVIIHRGGVVLWALDAVRWFDHCSSAVGAPAGAGLSGKVSLAVLQCWLCHHQHSVAGTSAAVTGAVVLSALPSTAVAAVSQGSVNQMVQFRLQPIAPVPGAGGDSTNKNKKKGKGRPTPQADEASSSNPNSGSAAGTIANQILFAKQLEQVMKLGVSPVGGAPVPCKSSKYVITALSTLPEASLLSVAKQGQLCRPVLDTFLSLIIKHTNTNPNSGAASGRKGGSSSAYTEDFRRFLSTLMGCALELAAHPTGMHVLKQLFEQCTNFAVKETLATLLHTHYESLMGGSGRNVARVLLLSVCRIDVFHKYGAEEWQRIMTGPAPEEESFLASLDAQQQQFQKGQSKPKVEAAEEQDGPKKGKREREPEEGEDTDTMSEKKAKKEKKEKKDKKEKKEKRSRVEE